MFQNIFEEIKKSESIVIFGHIFPDGDCYGSQIALRNSLRKAFPNKKIFAVGSGLKIFFDVFSPMDTVEDKIISSSLAILLDGNDVDRMEDKRASQAKRYVKIDHHIENVPFCRGPKVVNEDASSTCELIYDFIQECNLPIDKTIANCLFLGMSTDTGKFSFVEPFSDTIIKAGKLCKLGANPSQISYILGLTDENVLAFRGFYLSNYKKSKNGVIYIVIKQSDLNKFQISAARAASSLNLIGNVKGCDVWCAFAEDKDGSYRSEFRSHLIDVQKIAVKYGGGGHIHASGATLYNFSNELLNNIIKDFENEIKKRG